MRHVVLFSLFVWVFWGSAAALVALIALGGITLLAGIVAVVAFPPKRPRRW